MDHNPGSSVLGLLERFIERDAARLGGVPVFRGTRVPVKSLFDHLEAGDSLDIFLEDFPGVTREQAQAVIEIAGRHLFDEAKIASGSSSTTVFRSASVDSSSDMRSGPPST